MTIHHLRRSGQPQGLPLQLYAVANRNQERNPHQSSMTQFKHPSPAIIFDFGGVLIDWNPRYLYLKLFDNDRVATERFLNEIGFVEWNMEQDRGRPFAVAVQ